MKAYLHLESLEGRYLLATYQLIDLGAYYGTAYSSATAINNDGIAVGTALHGQGVSWFDQEGVIHDLGTYGGLTAINDGGVIVGYQEHIDFARACVWDTSGHFVDLGIIDSYANGIN